MSVIKEVEAAKEGSKEGIFKNLEIMQGARKWTTPFLVAIEVLLKHVVQGDVERHLH